MIKSKYITHTLIIALFFLAGCGGCGNRGNHGDKSGFKSHLIDLDTAIAFRTNFLEYDSQNYHIPVAFMFKIGAFDSLFQAITGINALRLYPAINTHGDANDDSLTWVMVPVNASNQQDNFTGSIYEFANLCPSKCSCAGSGSNTAPTEDSLDYIIPTSWYITKTTIDQVITNGGGTGHVDGIRFYTEKKADGTMDLILVATRDNGSYFEDIGDRIKNAATTCRDGKGSCDTRSVLYHPTMRGK
jgi:hypothetical protein